MHDSRPPDAGIATAYLICPHPREVTAFSLGFMRAIVIEDIGRLLPAMYTSTPDLLVADPARFEDGMRRICAAATRAAAPPAVLAICDDVGGVPAALRAGCNAVLIRPISRSLVAMRVSRLLKREGVYGGAFATSRGLMRCPEQCPNCGAPHPVGFDAVALRRWWFACLRCDHTWIDTLADPRVLRPPYDTGVVRRDAPHAPDGDGRAVRHDAEPDR